MNLFSDLEIPLAQSYIFDTLETRYWNPLFKSEIAYGSGSKISSKCQSTCYMPWRKL